MAREVRLLFKQMGPERAAIHCLERLADYQNSVLLQGMTQLAESLDKLATQQAQLMDASVNIMEVQKKMASKIEDDGHGI